MKLSVDMIEVPYKWEAPVGRMIGEIAEAATRLNVEEINILQIKEKYGELRVYYVAVFDEETFFSGDIETKEIDDVIEVYKKYLSN